MKRRYDYKVCPFCGASLDIGEACDCKDDSTAPKTPRKANNPKQAYKTMLNTEKALQTA